MSVIISGAEKYGYGNIEDPLRSNWKWQGIVFDKLKDKLSKHRGKAPNEYKTDPYYWEKEHATYSHLR